MPRKYARKVGGRQINTSDPDMLKMAVKAVVENGMSLRKAAEQFNVKRSTLADRVKGKHSKSQGGQTVLSPETERLLVNRLILCASWGFPLTLFDLRIIVKAYLDRRGLTVSKFADNLPGLEWAKSFMNRHRNSLSERLSQNIKLSRAEVGPETIRSFFDNLKKEIEGVPPSNIVNYDETNLTDDPGRKKVVVKRGSRYPERIQNSSKSSTSLMLAGAADGTILPYYVVYKSKHLYDTWITGGPDRCRFNRSKSGWFDNVCFEDWFTNVILPYMRRLDGKKILIGDNLSSHVSAHVIEKCEEANISFVLLPPNSTHLTQPLDVAFFRPMKSYWRQIIDHWRMSAEGRRCPTIPKDVFPRLLKELNLKLSSAQAENIKSGFRKCGMVPFDPTKVLCRIPEPAGGSSTGAENNQPSTSGTGDVDAAFMELLNDMRGMDEVRPKKRASRLQVSPGKSVSCEDIDTAESDSDSADGGDIETGASDTEDSETESENERALSGRNETARQSPYSGTTAFQLTGVKPIQKISNLKADTWVVVKLGDRHKRLYVALTEQVYHDDNDLEVAFLRRKGLKKDIFFYPEQPDKALVDFDQVVGTVNNPEELRRGLLKFPVDATEWM